jgi:hypothetical protein
VDHLLFLDKGNPNLIDSPGSLGCSPRPGVIDQDTAHQLRGQPDELRPVFPVHTILFKQAQIRLMDQSGGLKSMPTALLR